MASICLGLNVLMGHNNSICLMNLSPAYNTNVTGKTAICNKTNEHQKSYLLHPFKPIAPIVQVFVTFSIEFYDVGFL